MQTIVSLVSAGMGVALVPQSLQEPAAHGRRRTRPLAESGLRTGPRRGDRAPCGARRRWSPVLAGFIDIVRAHGAADARFIVRVLLEPLNNLRCSFIPISIPSRFTWARACGALVRPHVSGRVRVGGGRRPAAAAPAPRRGARLDGEGYRRHAVLRRARHDSRRAARLRDLLQGEASTPRIRSTSSRSGKAACRFMAAFSA